jgi:hypothetical protein
MRTQTITRAAESNFEPAELYKILAEAGNIPKWAPVFADVIERIKDAHYRVTKNSETFDIEVVLHPSAGTVDYIRKMSNGKSGGAYIRVMPRPLGGSTISMTVPVGLDTPETDVADTLDQELASLIQLASS